MPRLKTKPWTAFRYVDFRWFQVARFFSTLGIQMQSVAVGWQVYDITQNPVDLGYVGLAQFLPLLLFSLVSGHVADRYDRRVILWIYHGLLALSACLFMYFTWFQSGQQSIVWPIFLLLLMTGAARAFGGPAASALMPSLVSTTDFSNALAWNSSVWQTATVLGPALGGVLYGIQGGPMWVYGSCGCAFLISFLAIGAIRTKTGSLHRESASWTQLLAGLRYVFEHKILLGAISLDLFAVLLGGATALLPVFARDILAVGPFGLGILRSAPAFGAVATSLALAVWPLKRHSGAVMLICVGIFGLFTCVFALSTSFILSTIALVIMGAADVVSVFIRQTLIQLKTPPLVRGRVSAVSQVFISASNELGEFESGITAGWFGVVPAAFYGGVGTLLIVALWAALFKELREADRLLPEIES